MQFDLFANQKYLESKPESHGTIARRALEREAAYQATKAETEKLQRQWLAGKTRRVTQIEEKKNNSKASNNIHPFTLVLISCVSKKLSEPAQAKDLYVSDWFLKARAFAESVGDEWMILSARYELLKPETVIEPYDHTLYGQRKGDRDAWASRVANKIHSQIPMCSRIIIVAGTIYREFLISKLEDRYEILIPLRGLGIGQQLSFLKKVNKNG